MGREMRKRVEALTIERNDVIPGEWDIFTVIWPGRRRPCELSSSADLEHTLSIVSRNKARGSLLSSKCLHEISSISLSEKIR